VNINLISTKITKKHFLSTTFYRKMSWTPSFFDYDPDEESIGSYMARKQNQAEFFKELDPRNWRKMMEDEEESYLKENAVGYKEWKEEGAAMQANQQKQGGQKKNKAGKSSGGQNTAGGSGQKSNSKK
jgi:hypothetical protein